MNKIKKLLHHRRFNKALLISFLTITNWIAMCNFLFRFVKQPILQVIIILVLMLVYLRFAIEVGGMLDKYEKYNPLQKLK